MKGTTELTQSSVAYLLIAIIVVVIAYVILGKTVTLIEQHKFASLFEPGKITAGFSGIEVKCSGSTYQIFVNDANFVLRDDAEKEGPVFNFLVILDFKNKLVVGYDTDAGKPEFACTASPEGYQCPGDKKLYFEVAGVRPSAKELLHFTIWRNSAGVRSILGLDGTSSVPEEKRTLTTLLDNQFHHYMATFTSGAQVNFVLGCT